MENSTNTKPWYAENSGLNTPADGQARPPAAPVMEQAKEKAGQVAEQAKTQVMSQLATQKERASEGLGSVAQALRQTGQQLQQQDQAPFGQYIEQAADVVERFSGSLRERDVRELIDQVEGFARRQPAAFLGGAFMLGLLAARFLKSSSPYGSTAAGASRPIGYPSSTTWTAPPSTPAGVDGGAGIGAREVVSRSPVTAGPVSDVGEVTADVEEEEEYAPVAGPSSEVRPNDVP